MELLLKEMTTTEIQRVTVFHSGIKVLAKVKSQKLIILDMQHMHMEYIM